MSEHNGLRLSFIAAVLFGALAIVFSPLLVKLRHPGAKVGQIVKLNPGIDMVGGTSLVYEIKPPDNFHPDGKLASAVADALKRRVDPNGVRNLIWRPQGDTRLEIQMPLSPDAASAAELRRTLREQMIAAEDALKATNVAANLVIDAIEGKNGKTQADLDRMISDSASRKKLFTDLKDMWNKIQAAHAAQDADAEAKLKIEYDRLLNPKTASGAAARSPIEESNLQGDQLQQLLSSSESTGESGADTAADIKAQHQKVVDELSKKYADFPSRVAAIKRYNDAYTALSSAKGAIDDATDLKRLLKGAGVLEYHILAIPQRYWDPTSGVPSSTLMPQATYDDYVERLQTDGPRVRAGDEAKWFLVDKPGGMSWHTETYNKKIYCLGYSTPDPGPEHKVRSLDSHMPKPWRLTDSDVENQEGEQVVGFQFDPQGADYFGDLTEANKGRPMAIVLDNKIISAPTINSRIGARGIITGGKGGFTGDELDYLVNTLKAGSLPATLSEEPISERTVGPQLGADNLNAGLIACVLGLVVVAIFLCSYYFIAGIVATAAVVMNVLLVLAVMSAFDATFTLPSIAGIVLSVGTAVDANVLIFERLREEQHRGLSLRLALKNAYGKALSAILDSNMTTFITSLFLIWKGSEEVRGFGVTLVIGIVASLFTALFVTRSVFTLLMDHFGVKDLKSIPLVFPKWDKALRPNIDWMGKAWAFIAFSVIGITIGMVMFVVKVRKGEMMGIEFASGTSVQFELAKSMKQAELLTLLQKFSDEQAKAGHDILPSPNVVTVGTNDTTYEVVTPNSDAVHVRDAVLKALVDANGQTLLKVDVPSKFDGSGTLAAGQINKVIFALEDKKTPAKAAWPNGYVPEDVRDYEPGVAIVLNQIDPPLSPGQISDRIRQRQLQLQSGDPAAALTFTVESPLHNAEAKTSTAVILCRNDLLPYSKDPTKWQEAMAAPLWNLTNESVNRPAQLQQVKNFDAQVARDATTNALLALTFSILVIMVYIWFRFGDLKYGTATMLALIHDVLFTIAALGLAHYLWNVPLIGKLLQLEPFRIDLTVVAGILTIMGYSMIDTIVVFDRIRENRGKFGLVNRNVINDAINQTLSRTLLTAGTNVLTVAIMYFVGGPGLHGFTFVLLIGILVGTYSSVAIAAPFLLVGRQEEAPERVAGRARPARV